MVNLSKTHKIISVSVSTLKYNTIIDITGDKISYENLTESIKRNGVLEPIFIDTNNVVVSGNRRVFISKELGLKTIPSIIVDKNLSKFEIEKLRADFLITNRNLSYIDICKIYTYQSSIFEKHNQSYTEYMGDKMKCSRRDIQLKIKIGKMYSTLPSQIKSIFENIDSNKKIPLKTLKVMSQLNDIDLKNFNKDILKHKDMEHKTIVSITKKYLEMLNNKARKEKIGKVLEENFPSEKESESSLTEVISENDDEQENSLIEDSLYKNELNSSLSPSDTIQTIKQVLRYEIKKSFHLQIEPSEEKTLKTLQSKFQIDFKEEIELIKSLLKGGK